ncbi:MAG: hypothetical protein RLZZ08_492 [Pseudomonadota bacterium]|jgi:protein-disulfide isomerase
MRWFATIVIALVAGFTGAALWDVSGLGGRSTRAYLLANPEVLPEAIDVLKLRESQARIDPMRRELEMPFPGAVIGNPNGTVTLVEFTDYACTYCRQSVADIASLVAANPNLRVVVREYPILIPASADAARMALAAAQQGKYAAFHDAMFRMGPPSAQTIAAAATAAGVDMAQAKAAIASGVFDVQLRGNAQMAANLGITGTPGWVIGNQLLNGAVGRDVLAKAIDEVKPS